MRATIGGMITSTVQKHGKAKRRKRAGEAVKSGKPASQGARSKP